MCRVHASALFRAEPTGVAEFITETLNVYHRHFWLFIKIVVPAVLIGTLAVVVARNESREIARHVPRGIEILKHETEILEIWFATLAGYFVSWTAFAFSFGAMCVAVHGLAMGRIPSISECFAAVRDRLGSFVRLSTLLFFLLMVAQGATSLLETGFLWVLRRFAIHLSGSAIWFISFAFISLAALVISRFALAIPALILDNCKVSESIFRSDGLTEHSWLILAALSFREAGRTRLHDFWPV